MNKKKFIILIATHLGLALNTYSAFHQAPSSNPQPSTGTHWIDREIHALEQGTAAFLDDELVLYPTIRAQFSSKNKQTLVKASLCTVIFYDYERDNIEWWGRSFLTNSTKKEATIQKMNRYVRIYLRDNVYNKIENEGVTLTSIMDNMEQLEQFIDPYIQERITIEKEWSDRECKRRLAKASTALFTRGILTGGLKHAKKSKNFQKNPKKEISKGIGKSALGSLSSWLAKTVFFALIPLLKSSQSVGNGSAPSLSDNTAPQDSSSYQPQSSSSSSYQYSVPEDSVPEFDTVDDLLSGLDLWKKNKFKKNKGGANKKRKEVSYSATSKNKKKRRPKKSGAKKGTKKEPKKNSKEAKNVEETMKSVNLALSGYAGSQFGQAAAEVFEAKESTKCVAGGVGTTGGRVTDRVVSEFFGDGDFGKNVFTKQNMAKDASAGVLGIVFEKIAEKGAEKMVSEQHKEKAKDIAGFCGSVTGQFAAESMVNYMTGESSCLLM